jgi:AraC family transcriptional regulator
MAFLGQRRLSQVGPPLALTNRWDQDGYGFDAGVPISAPTEMKVAADSVVKVGQIPAGRAVRVIHRGPYDGLPATGEKLEAYLTVHGLEAAGRPWDVFISDPGSTAPEELETHVFVPLG